jgi:hypothetical protein
MKLKRIINFFAVLFIVVSLLSSCGGASDTVTNDTTSTDEVGVDTTTTEAVTEAIDTPDIPKSDYNGQTFTILNSSWSLYNDYYFAEEANGEAMNDAIYERTSKIEEELNIDIQNYVPGYIEKITPELRKTVMAGLDTYQLVLSHCTTDFTVWISDRLAFNWNDIPYIDMEKSYWNQTFKGTVESNGVQGYAINDFILPDVNTIFFNKDLYQNYELDDPYQLVKNGGWTWDKFIEISSKASADINGDGVFDDQDQYGFVGEIGWQFESIPIGADIFHVRIDSAGTPSVTIYTEKTVNLFEKLYSMLNSGNIAFTWGYSSAYDPNNNGTPPVDFNAGKALHYLVPLSLASRFRTMDVDFGILPLPKYDETQTDYLSLNWSGYMAVPMTISDPEFVGKVVEYLGYYNSDIVIPAFYDILLGQKISRDDDSNDMLDIIFDNAVYDLGIPLGLSNIVQTFLQAGSDFTSQFTKNENTWNTAIEKYALACINYIEVQ